MGVKCFWLEETGKLRRYLRRYADECPARPYKSSDGADHLSYHNAMVLFDEVDHPPNTTVTLDDKAGRPPADDPRWPSRCEYCGYAFLAEDTHQVFVERLYRRTDTGEIMILDAAPPGAMWNAWWYADHGNWAGPDGRSIMVKCPDGHDWCIDSRASNCTMPKDNVHKCWVRHGEPPNLTVDKNGVTCGAGAGSIQTPKWHGFLRNGELVVS